jgi:hypothetical protein
VLIDAMEPALPKAQRRLRLHAVSHAAVEPLNGTYTTVMAACCLAGMDPGGEAKHTALEQVLALESQGLSEVLEALKTLLEESKRNRKAHNDKEAIGDNAARGCTKSTSSLSGKWPHGTKPSSVHRKEHALYKAYMTVYTDVHDMLASSKLKPDRAKLCGSNSWKLSN